MVFVALAVKFIELMFFVGLAGAGIVVLLSFVQDFKELFGEE